MRERIKNYKLTCLYNLVGLICAAICYLCHSFSSTQFSLYPSFSLPPSLYSHLSLHPSLFLPSPLLSFSLRTSLFPIPVAFSAHDPLLSLSRIPNAAQDGGSRPALTEGS